MGLFDHNIVTNDEIVLTEYNFLPSGEYPKIMILEKRIDGDYWWMYKRSIFVPPEIIWKYYFHDLKEGLFGQNMRRDYGMSLQPNKKEFIQFCQTFKHDKILSIWFRGQIYIEKSTLQPLFDAFNEHLTNTQCSTEKPYNF